MGLFSYLYSKLILEISQIALKGFRDPQRGCASEPFGFIEAVGDEC